MTRLVSVERTPGQKKEFVAIFEKDQKRYTRRFGTPSNYVLNSKKTDKDRDAYRARHSAHPKEKQHLSDPMSPASLSMNLLWGDSRSLKKNVTAYKKKFSLT